MKQNSKEETYKKWAPILDNIGITGSKADWMAEYAQKHFDDGIQPLNTNIVTKDTEVKDFPSILPIAMKVATQTIGSDLVSVVPLSGGNSGDEMEKIRQEVKKENRDRKIDSIVVDKDFKEMKPEEHPDYIEPTGATGHLFYLDFKYGDDEEDDKNKK